MISDAHKDKVKVLQPFDESLKEGRMIALEFEKFVLVAVYTPHSGVGELKRLSYRVEQWDREFEKYLSDIN